MRMRAGLAAVASGMLIAAGGPRAEDPADLSAAWAELRSTNETTAAGALLRLAAEPEAATRLLGERLEPVVVEPARVREWIKELGSESREKRLAAIERLEALGSYAREPLEEALADGPSQLVESQIRELLEQLPAAPPRGAGGGFGGSNVSVQSVNGAVTIVVDGRRIDLGDLTGTAAAKPDPFRRALRAIALLERFGTPEARAQLERLAKGEPGASPTREAALALKRLQARAGR